MTTLWKGLCQNFSPDPVFLDNLIGKRLRKAGLKGSRTRGSCTFASTDFDQAKSYSDTPDQLVTVQPHPGSIITWSPDSGDLVLSFESFLFREKWGDLDWAKPTAYEIMRDVQGCSSTFEQYVREFPRSRALNQIVDYWLDEISVREITYRNRSQMTDGLDGHAGEVWITGGCTLVPQAPSAEGIPAAA